MFRQDSESFNALKWKVEAEKEKGTKFVCGLQLDEMSIRRQAETDDGQHELAQKALVFLAVGSIVI